VVDPSQRGGTTRTTPSRHADRASHDLGAARRVLAEALVGHLGFVDGSGLPVVLPVAIAPDDDQVLFHGSTGSRMFRALAAGAPACLTVTLLDGLVMARSAFESSMNYRSLVVLGTARELVGADKARALRVLTDHLTPDRWADLRPMTTKEQAATCVLALPLVEFSVKSRRGGTDEPEADRAWPAWAGQVPVRLAAGPPVPEPGVPAHVAVPTLPAGVR
jgi:nitroimidazol reductase NimA-like FMN-containing flavoprotein (pyridoxamine 5'-phosphate oxidase superfamily)